VDKDGRCNLWTTYTSITFLLHACTISCRWPITSTPSLLLSFYIPSRLISPLLIGFTGLLGLQGIVTNLTNKWMSGWVGYVIMKRN
jgi:hypothetical protein